MLKTVKNPDNNITKEIISKLKETGGYCPCVLPSSWNEDTKCPCKDFREQLKEGKCHCGLFIKKEVVSDA